MCRPRSLCPSTAAAACASAWVASCGKRMHSQSSLLMRTACALSARGQCGLRQLQAQARSPATAFQDRHRQSIGRGLELQSQGRRRGFACRCSRPVENAETAARFSCELQAAHIFVADPGWPAQYGTECRTQQSLLRCPERFLQGRAANDQHALERQTALRERRRMGQIGRCNPGDVAPGAGQARQGWQQYTELANAARRRHQLGDGTERPAAAGQARIELREARGRCCQWAATPALAQPGQPLERCAARRYDGYHTCAVMVYLTPYCINIQFNSVTG